MKTTPSDPPLPKVDTAAYLAWIQAFRSHIPALAALNRFPRKLAIAARNAFLCFPSASDYAPQIGRYYAAPADAVSTYRPASLLLFFLDLYDIATHARNYCDRADAAARKLAPRPRNSPPLTPISDAEAAESRRICRELKKSLSSPMPGHEQAHPIAD